MKSNLRLLMSVLMVVCVIAPAMARGTPETAEATAMGGEKEAPMLAAMVVAEDLPALEDRLPVDPKVVEPVEEIGEYGGTMTRGWLGPADPWGMHSTGSQALMHYSPDGARAEPNLARELEILEGGKVFVIHLREGVRWSDGVPFTADDIMFAFHDVAANEALYPSYPNYLTVRGQPPTSVEKIDDYTVRITFPEVYGLFPLELNSNYGTIFAPSHYLKQFHADYANADELAALVEEGGFESWSQLYLAMDYEGHYWHTNPDRPVLWPWKLTAEGTTDSHIVWERNPYYWKVDTEGNQLPYIDRVTWDLVQDSQVLNLRAMSGDLDMQAKWLTTNDYALFKQNEEAGDYRVLLWADTYGVNPAFFVNASVQDPAKRALFNNIQFKQALSLAINREELNELAYLGLGIPRQASMIRESGFYSAEWESNYAEYDPAQANAILDGIGMTARDSDGFRLDPDGNPLQITIEWTEQFDNWMDVMPLVVEYWRAIGVNVAEKNQERSLLFSRWTSNEADIVPWSQPGLSVLFNKWWWDSSWGAWAPGVKAWVDSDGESGIEPPNQDIIRMMDIATELAAATDPAEIERLADEGIALHVKHLWLIGTVGNLPQVVIVKNRVRNVPETGVFDNKIGFPRVAVPEQFFIRQ